MNQVSKLALRTFRTGSAGRQSRSHGPWRKRARRGLWIVLLGPDGAGKSAVIAALASEQRLGFAGCATYHLRPTPSWRQRETEVNRDPHGQTARGTLISVFKLIYLLVANWMGYLVAVRPQLAQGKLILFDRYFPDCLVDRKRYRLPGSCRRMTEVISGMLPQPDWYVVLDAPASVLQERKCEVTWAESERQRKEYVTSMARFPNVAAVDAARPVRDVAGDILERIIGLRTTRRSERCGIA